MDTLEITQSAGSAISIMPVAKQRFHNNPDVWSLMFPGRHFFENNFAVFVLLFSFISS